MWYLYILYTKIHEFAQILGLLQKGKILSAKATS